MVVLVRDSAPRGLGHSTMVVEVERQLILAVQWNESQTGYRNYSSLIQTNRGTQNNPSQEDATVLVSADFNTKIMMGVVVYV